MCDGNLQSHNANYMHYNQVDCFSQSRLVYITFTRQCNINAIFMAVKMSFFYEKCDNFLNCAQNIDCGFTLEPSQ